VIRSDIIRVSRVGRFTVQNLLRIRVALEMRVILFDD